MQQNNVFFLSIQNIEFDHFWICILLHVTPYIQMTEEIIIKYAVDANLFRLGSSLIKQ